MEDENKLFDRRTVLKASSITAGWMAFSGKVSASSGEDEEAVSDMRNPDIRITDNSDSNDPIRSKIVNEDGDVIKRFNFETIGFNHPDLEDLDIDSKVSKAVKSVERIDVDYSGRVEVVFQYRDEKTTTQVHLRDGEAGKNTGVSLNVTPEGELLSSTGIYCD